MLSSGDTWNTVWLWHVNTDRRFWSSSNQHACWYDWCSVMSVIKVDHHSSTSGCRLQVELVDFALCSAVCVWNRGRSTPGHNRPDLFFFSPHIKYLHVETTAPPDESALVSVHSCHWIMPTVAISESAPTRPPSNRFRFFLFCIEK